MFYNQIINNMNTVLMDGFEIRKETVYMWLNVFILIAEP